MQLLSRQRLFAIVLVIAFTPVWAEAQTEAVTPGALRAYSTIYSIGVEWDVLNDIDHDARVLVDYRLEGAATWSSGLPLMRIDYNGSNQLAGSLLFLSPGTRYELRLSLTDPDGGAETRDVTIATRALPLAPAAGRVFHVVPGSGGGSGTEAAPFAGIAAAQAVAQPGDTFLLHAGDYGGRIRFTTAGTTTAYIAWRAARDGEVLLRGIDIAASNIWLEGLTVRNLTYATFSIGAPSNVVVTRCRFLNNLYSIYLQQGGSGWYIADNTIVGSTTAASESFEGEGIELNTSSGHTVAHNSITNVADGISYPDSNVDMFGNDIFDVSDDGIEPDYGRANVRMWGNRIHNAVHNGISFQPQLGGPWYIVRNQLINSKESPFKFRTTDRFVLVHNTIVNWGNAWPGDQMMCCNQDHLLRSFARNNLWISVQGGQIWSFGAALADWRTSLDYNGFDWGAAPAPFSYAGLAHPDVWSFASASGLETHGVRVDKSGCFEQFDVPGPSPASVPPQILTLRTACTAIDVGEPLPNVNDGYAGSAPDLGAHEYQAATAVYGPRGSGPTPPPSNQAPAVSLTAPLDGATFAVPASVVIAAQAADPDGTIAAVEFYAGSRLLGTAMAGGAFSILWQVEKVGTYTLTARAIDNIGLTATSAPLTVQITKKPRGRTP
jgi:hypothetical protein